MIDPKKPHLQWACQGWRIKNIKACSPALWDCFLEWDKKYRKSGKQPYAVRDSA